MRALLAGSARGLAVGALVATLCCAAFAAQGLHTGLQPLDWLIGVVLVALPMLLIFILLRVPTALAAWLLRLLGRRTSGRTRHLVLLPVPLLRLAGRPLLATTLAIVWMTWLTPVDGPLAMYHSMFYFEILIATGALSGLLLGGVASLRATTSPSAPGRRLAVAAALGLAILLAAGSVAWAAYPGFGDGLAPHELVPASIAQLDLPDPSQPGPYAVSVVAYGSGNEVRRPEFGADATWRTPTVDASAALPDRQFPDNIYAPWWWGFDESELPLNALLWYPTDAPGRLPVALIVHGNHDAGDFSDPGYAYLAASLASHGIVTASVDENFLNGDSFFDYQGAEMATRAWFLLRHLDQLRTWDTTPGHPLYGRLDLDRVALMGHSRGGEAATLAAMFEQNEQLRVAGLGEVPRGFGVRAVVAIAPSDTMYRGTGSPAKVDNIDYLVIQGAHDGDLAGFDGLGAYHRAEFEAAGHLKAAVYVGRANHGRFNSVWDYGDAGPLTSWLLDRGSLLSPAEQQRVAETVIGAFLARSLLDETGYDAFFREPRSGSAWLPEDVVESHWQTSDRVMLEPFSTFDDDALAADGFDEARCVDVPLRDKLTQHDRAALLSWQDTASLGVPVPDPTLAPPDGSLVFSLAAAPSSASPSAAAVNADPTISLCDARGECAAARLSSIAPPRPALPVQLWKIAGLGDRYAPTERHAWPAEHFLQTYAVPLRKFTAITPALDLSQLASIGFSFDGSGSAYLDDVGFEPGT